MATRVGAADTSGIPGGTPSGSCDGRLTQAFYDSIVAQLDDGNTRAETDAIVGCVGEDEDVIVDTRIYTDNVNNTVILVFFLDGLSVDSDFEPLG